MATFTGQAATNNMFTGTAGADKFLWAAVNLNSLDRAAGAGGVDLLQLITGGSLAADALAGVTGIERIVLNKAGSGITLANANFAGVLGGRVLVIGGAGADTVDGSKLTGANRIDVTAGAGTDVLKGGAGRDVFRFKAVDLGSSDQVQGGAGKDMVLLTAQGTVTAEALANVAGVETIQFGKTGNSLTLANANFAGVAGAKILVKGGAGADTVNGAGLTGANAIDVIAGAGADVLSGGAGRDTFRFRALDLAGDTILGNGGLDQLLLANGGALVASALANMDGVEAIRLAAAGNSITVVDGNFTGVAGARITVFGGAGDDTVDGSKLTGARRIDVTAGLGADVLKGGAGADVFRFTAAALAGDTLTGGLGSDTLRITTAGTLAEGALDKVSGVETIQLAAGGNAITLKNLNFTNIKQGAFATLTVRGGSGNDTVDGSMVTQSPDNSTSPNLVIEAGGGLDVLRGGRGINSFRFAAAELDGDTIRGGGGSASDELVITQGGVLKADQLRNVTGIDAIVLEQGSTTLTLQDAFFGAGGRLLSIREYAAQGTNIIDAADLTGENSIYVEAGIGGSNRVFGGAGGDTFVFYDGAVFGAGDSFDGGDGRDAIVFDRAMDFLGDTITNVEVLDYAGGGNITISGENAAGFVQFGYDNFAAEVYTVQLSAGSTIDLSKLTLGDTRSLDAINVVSTGGAGTSTSVTLSAAIASFTGSAGNDTVGLAPGGQYKTDVVIDGGEGDDRIAFDGVDLVDAVISGGAGLDTLVLTSGATIDLAQENQFASGLFAVVSDFEGVDASALTVGVSLRGRSGASSTLIGGSGDDTITAGAGGAFIIGGLGADMLVGGPLDNTFVLRSTEEAQGDTIVGGGGGVDALRVAGDADLTVAAISGIKRLVLGARDAAGIFFVAGNVTATVSGTLASSGIDIRGSVLPATVETLVVNHSGDSQLTLLSLKFADWSGGDLVVINGTSGVDVIIGTGQNDVINGGFGADTLLGVDGDDVIGYSQLSTFQINGGNGTDTIRLDNLAAPGGVSSTVVDLAAGTIVENRAGGGSPDSVDAREFENADFSRNDIFTRLEGSAVANVLIGGSAGDLIIGAGGRDTLTGGEGADRFVWRAKADGGDTITDFTRSEDQLNFDFEAFTFAGDDFDQVTFDSGSGSLNLDNTDLLIAGQTLESADDVRAFVNNNSTSTQHGMFVVATTTSGSRVLYYTSNASALGTDNAFFQIADLGAGPAPALGDFVFV